MQIPEQFSLSLNPSELADDEAKSHQIFDFSNVAAKVGVEAALADKSLAVSSLHKSIRRGNLELAFRATALLLQLDPIYLFARLPVLAYEDIGIANPKVCLRSLLGTSKRLQNLYGQKELAYSLVRELTLSSKSRTATDIFCMTLSDPCAHEYLMQCKSYKAYQLLSTALDTHLSLSHRMTAIQLICGFKERSSNGYYITHSRPSLEVLNDLCDSMNVNDGIKQMVLNGQGKTAGLNGSILLAYELMSNSQNLTVCDQALKADELGGVMLCAYDSYCQPGRQVIERWYSQSLRLQKLCRELQIRNPKKFLGVFLFQTEGSLLNRTLVFDESIATRNHIEKLEMEEFGVNVNMMEMVCSVIRGEMSQLHNQRLHAQGIRLRS